MKPVIALVTGLDQESEKAWQRRLSQSMPDETILAYRAMTADQKRHCEIAIVANPDPAEVRSLASVKWIQSLWAGVEGLMTGLGPNPPPIVRMANPDLSRVMAEAVLAWTLYLQRDMPTYARLQSERVWQQQRYRSPSTVNVGILGVGALGQAAATRLSDNGFVVSGWARTPKPMSSCQVFLGEPGLQQLLAQSDIVVCLLPLTPATTGLLGLSRLGSMKQGAALINFARGPIVDVAALLSVLESGHLSHAVLDVFDTEPLPPSSPLWASPKVTILPHISAPTEMESACAVVVDNISRYRREGSLPACVTVEA